MSLFTFSANPSTESFKSIYRIFHNCKEVKKQYLFAGLVNHYPNLVDNLLSKGNLSFVDLKEHILRLASTGQLSKHYIGGNGSSNENNSDSNALKAHNCQE